MSPRGAFGRRKHAVTLHELAYMLGTGYVTSVELDASGRRLLVFSIDSNTGFLEEGVAPVEETWSAPPALDPETPIESFAGAPRNVLLEIIEMQRQVIDETRGRALPENHVAVNTDGLDDDFVRTWSSPPDKGPQGGNTMMIALERVANAMRHTQQSDTMGDSNPAEEVNKHGNQQDR